MAERVNAFAAAAAVPASATGLREYTHALHGFAIKAPASSSQRSGRRWREDCLTDRHSATIYNVYSPEQFQ